MTTENMPDNQLFDDATVEAVLTARQTSGDPALDTLLSTLRAIGQEAAPEPPTELRALLLGQSGPAARVTPLDVVRGTRTKHILPGSAAVAGVLLMSATAAAAIGVHVGADQVPAHVERARPRPAEAPGAEPHAAPTTPTGLPPIGRLGVPAPATSGAHGATASGAGDDDDQRDEQSPAPRRTEEDGQDQARPGEARESDQLAPGRDEDEPSTAPAVTSTEGDPEDDATSDDGGTAPAAPATTEGDDGTEGGDGDG